MTRFTHDHIHLRSRDPEAAVSYYEKMFGAEILKDASYSDGEKRIAFVLCGITFFIAPIRNLKLGEAPVAPYLGLEHIGLGVTGIDEVAADLKKKGAEFTMEPKTLRPGVRVAFLRGPDNVMIEILERGTASGA